MSNIKHAGSAATEHAQEISQKGQYELNKNIAQNPDLPFGERAQGAVDAVGNKVSEKTHEVKKAYHQNQAGLTSDVYTSSPEHKSTTVDSTIQHAGSAATEHAQEIGQRGQYEMNKNMAQNPDLPMGERAQGALDAFGNKISEKTHEVKKAYHQNQAGLSSDVYTSSPEHKSPTVDSTVKHAGSAACQHAKEIDQRDQFQLNKNIAQNPDFPLSDRARGAVDAVGNKISEKAHEVNKVYHQNQAGLSSDVYTSSPEHKSPTVDSTIKHAGSAATEHAQEIGQRGQYEVNKDIAQNPDLPFGERAQGAFGAVGNKISEKTHEVKKAYHQNQAGLSSDVYTSSPEHKSTTVDSTIKHAGSAAIEHAQEIGQRDQYEGNKDIAQNPDLPFGERAQGAFGAVGNKISEKAHEAKKTYHQNQAGLSSDVYTSSPEHKSTKVDSTIQHAGSAATEHAQEIGQRDQYELNKNVAQNPDLPIGERAQGAFDAFGNKISEKTHEVKKAYHQNQAGLTSDVKTSSPQQKSTISPKIKGAGIAAVEHSKEIDQKAQYQMNKNISKNPDLPMGERSQAAFAAVGNKVSEKAHEANKAIHQKQSFPTDIQPQEPVTQTPVIVPTFPLTSPTTVPVTPPPLPTLPVSTTPAVQLSTTVGSTLKHAGLAAKEHAQEIDQKVQYEMNKNIAANPELPVGERTAAAFEAVGNKISEKTHEVKKAFHQNQAGITSTDNAKNTL